MYFLQIDIKVRVKIRVHVKTWSILNFELSTSLPTLDSVHKQAMTEGFPKCSRTFIWMQLRKLGFAVRKHNKKMSVFQVNFHHIHINFHIFQELRLLLPQINIFSSARIYFYSTKSVFYVFSAFF